MRLRRANPMGLRPLCFSDARRRERHFVATLTKGVRS